MNFTTLVRLIESPEPDNLKDFLQTRKAGAHKIETQARRKGGLSLLTATHFKAKAIPYTKAINGVSKEDHTTLYKENTKNVFDKLSNWENLTMQEFQKLTGEFEAWGEAFIQSKS